MAIRSSAVDTDVCQSGAAPDSSAASASADHRILRHEIKAYCQESARRVVLSLLHTHPAGIRTLYPPRQVHSVYFDTPGGRALHENLGGLSEREKLRFRWYGPHTRSVEGHLERKARRDVLVWKERYAVPGRLNIAGENRRTLTRNLMEACSPRWREALQGDLEPVQWISYERAYFTTDDGTVRITVDHRLETHDLHERFTLSRKWPSWIPRILVVEFKAAPDHRSSLQSVLNALPFVRDKCSKFMLASLPSEFPAASHFPA